MSTASPPALRLLALDIDGTLLTSRKTISPRTRGAIRAAREAGVHLVLVTGRRYPAARRVAEDLGHDVPLVLHNGALIVENGVVLRRRPLPVETARRAVRLGRELKADPVLHCGLNGEGRLYVEGDEPSSALLVYNLDKSHPDVVCVADLESAVEEDPLQVMFAGALPALISLLPALARGLAGAVSIEKTFYPKSGVGFLDVLAPDVGKAEALAFLQQRYGLRPSQTLAIGDNWNDHDMLERAGVGLVMGNADPELCRLGLPVLPSNDEDGVAVAIERYILGLT